MAACDRGYAPGGGARAERNRRGAAGALQDRRHASGGRHSGLLLRRRAVLHRGRRTVHGGSDVCGVPDSPECEAPLSDRADPRRGAHGHIHDGDVGRPRGLEHLLPAPRVRGLRRGSDGARQVGLSHRRVRSDESRQRVGHPATLHRVTFLGPPTWFTDGPVQFPWGMTAIPMTYAPAVSDPSQLTFVPQAVADNPGVIRCWRQAEPARQLPNLQHVPILIVTSEAGYHSTYDQCTSEYLTQAGVPNAQVNLGDVGIHGNGHMMMIEKNNLDIAAFMQSWLEQNVEKGVRVPNH